MSVFAVCALGILAVGALAATIDIVCVQVRRRRRGRKRAQTCERTLEVVRHAEELADLVLLLVPDPPPSSALLAEIEGERSWLSGEMSVLRDAANATAFRRAASHGCDALALLGVEISRRESWSAVPDTLNDDKHRFASARLRERSAEFVVAARFMNIVADVEGC